MTFPHRQARACGLLRVNRVYLPSSVYDVISLTSQMFILTLTEAGKLAHPQWDTDGKSRAGEPGSV